MLLNCTKKRSNLSKKHRNYLPQPSYRMFSLQQERHMQLFVQPLLSKSAMFRARDSIALFCESISSGCSPLGHPCARVIVGPSMRALICQSMLGLSRVHCNTPLHATLTCDSVAKTLLFCANHQHLQWVSRIPIHQINKRWHCVLSCLMALWQTNGCLLCLDLMQ